MKRNRFQAALPSREVASRLEDYERAHDAGGVSVRKARASDLTKTYYDLATDFYEYGWGRSFHFAPAARGEVLAEAIVRYQHFLSAQLGLEGGMRVLDAGCGVGGPMIGIARFSGASITGLNINGYQIERGRRHVEEARLGTLCSFEEGDFTRMPFEDGSFYAAYVMESSCHAADRRDVFSEVFRVLAPGAPFAGSEWCLTDRFDPGDPGHVSTKRGIEKGNGLPDLITAPELEASLRDCGFRIVRSGDRAPTADPGTPWYSPLETSWTPRGFLHTEAGAWLTHRLVGLLELVRLSPPGTTSVHDLLRLGQHSLVEGGRTGIFTPMYFFLAEKPA
ncbi:MAG: methyltransferase domain-containing protein [Deltaproteobacteria bacterium]|nr:methyltransferase domain-containing protein [Deltaproteobacteria bacterium]